LNVIFSDFPIQEQTNEPKTVVNDFIQKSASTEFFPVKSSQERENTISLCPDTTGTSLKIPDLSASMFANDSQRTIFGSSALHVSPSLGGSSQLDLATLMATIKQQAMLTKFLSDQKVISQHQPQSAAICDQATWSSLFNSTSDADLTNFYYLISSLVSSGSDRSRDILSQLLKTSFGAICPNTTPATQGFNNDCNTIRLLSAVAQAKGKLSIDDLAFLLQYGK
jgi:hypothetical protein